MFSEGEPLNAIVNAFLRRGWGSTGLRVALWQRAYPDTERYRIDLRLLEELWPDPARQRTWVPQ